jgi:4-hydroxy-tetrahydrodipicolinate reductase
MSIIRVMVAGAPGRMANLIASRILDGKYGKDMLLIADGLAENAGPWEPVTNGKCIPLFEHRDAIKKHQPDVIVDFTQPTAVVRNAEIYCACGAFFVMGTTMPKENLPVIAGMVKKSDISAVIAPNMAKQIVAFMTMLEFAAKSFPGVFAGYRLVIEESHQAAKKDSSGTARALVKHFNALGIPFQEEQIIMVRDPSVQSARLGVPVQHLDGHGWHTYSLLSEDGTVLFRFTHNVNGRDIYAQGALDAIRFLRDRDGVRGEVFSMLDVISAEK